MNMISVTLPDGSVREVAPGTTPADIAAAIGPGLAKAAIAARVDGELRDIGRPLEQDVQLALVTSRDEADALELARHDFAHVLAEAVQALFPGTQITFGPATDDGFYYDVMAPASRDPFSMDDLPAIEEKMREIIRADKPLIREVWSREDLISRWEALGETFKAEWAKELPEFEDLTVYWSGDPNGPGGETAWLDMCRGPHLASTGKLDPQAFKLMRVAGAYWRGDQKNAQLTRIYGTGWLNKKQLDAHLHKLEEAAKRDHRKLGQEMDLFHLQQEAHGSVFWHPKGYMIWRELEAYMRRAIDGAGYREVKTPQVMDARQWEQSGHWGKYRENMFVIPDEVPNVDDEGPIVSNDADWMALKPMNCPAHILIFKQGIKSYRDLPLRFYENGCCHRNEPHGALHGLMRVRQFTQDDAHIFCREDQIVDEVKAFCALADRVYKDFGFTYSIKLALRPEKRFGTEAMWDQAEAELPDAVEKAGPATPENGRGGLPGAGPRSAPQPVTAEGPPPDIARPSGWDAIRARLPDEELPGILTLVAFAALVGIVVVGWATPTSALSVAVVVIGLRTVVDARSGDLPTGAVIVAGVLVLVLSACWWSGTDLDQRPRWATERPTEGLAAYEQAAGSLTIDLTDSPRPMGVTAKVGVGRVIVKVPDADVRAGLVDVRAKVAGGWVSVPIPRDDRVRPIGRDAGPALMDETGTRPGDAPTVVVRIDVGVGNVEVHRVR